VHVKIKINYQLILSINYWEKMPTQSQYDTANKEKHMASYTICTPVWPHCTY